MKAPGNRKITVTVMLAILASLAVLITTIVRTLGEHKGIYVIPGYVVVDTVYADETIPIEYVALDQVQLVDKLWESPYKVESRIIGSSAMNSGVYQLRNGERAIVEVQGKGQVLFIPVKNRADLLLRYESPSEFLEQLRGARQAQQ